MREIKFRGKDGDFWVYGALIKSRGLPIEILKRNTYYDTVAVDPETVGQFTGLRDEDGREIFEGDILSNGHDTVAVSYKDEWGAYVGLYHGLEELTFPLDECVNQPLDELKMKIVGNVYDNPELLERKP